MENIKEELKAVFNSYSEILFIENYVAGLILLLITFINPNLGISGIVAILSAYIFARFLGMGDTFLKTGFYTYNSLLVGLSVGYLFKITPLTIFFTVASSITTLIFSIMLYSLFSYYMKLPILSLPFVVISSTIYLAISNYSNLFVDSLYPHINFSFVENHLPVWITGFFKSFGAILFLPDVFVGFIFSVLVLLISRILFMLAVVGYYTGTITSSLLTGSFIQSFSDISHFNYILISMALGGIFLIPSIRSYIISQTAVIVSTIVLSATKTFWSFYGIPAFTLPFNFITLSFIYILGLINFPYVARFIRKTPEETLDFYLTNIKRYRGYYNTVHLPFSGRWTVWQGFNGKWTHKGSWRYAYDFVITDKDGKTYRNNGESLTDYYAYRKPVLSPVRGRVVKVISDLPDNPIGYVDRENNWGNLVVIYDSRGFYVEISHFAYNSIKVREGDWVEVGTFLGLCGNSGYSPQPHIHIQVQASSEIGSYTLPFSFVSYISDNRFYSNDLPEEGEIVEPVFPDKSLEVKMTFILDYIFVYDILKDGKRVDTLRLTVKMAPDGSFYFDSGKGKLYFGKYEGTFYFYRIEGDDPHLRLFFLALPKMPLFYKEGLQWEDYLPVKTVSHGIKRAVILFISSFNHNISQVHYTGQFDKNMCVTGKIKSAPLKLSETVHLQLDETAGIKSIKFKGLEIRLRKFIHSKEASV